jgi:hypothetical protein
MTENIEIASIAFRNFMDIFITPEVIKRQGAGNLPKPLTLSRAQIIFYANGRKPVIRINDEVRAAVKVKLKAEAIKHVNERVYEDDIEFYESIELIEEDDRDCGHATFIKHRGRWIMRLDVRYNKKTSRALLFKSRQYLSLSGTALRKRSYDAFIDNLFSAAELIAKTVLLRMPDKSFQDKANHKAIHSKFNLYSKKEIIGDRERKTFNRLASMRYQARYYPEKICITSSDARNMMKDIEGLFKVAEKLYE